MTPERWARVESILEEALERDTAGRAAFLEQACAGDQDLRREVESLLAFEGSGEQLVAHAVQGAAALFEAATLGPAPGERIGAYRVVREIGRDEVFLGPVRHDGLAPLREWVPIPWRSAVEAVQWSVDGSELYFFGDTAEEYSVEALPLDPDTKKVSGPKRTLYRFDRPRFRVQELSGLVATADSLIYSGLVGIGNIWLVKLPR